VLTSLLTSRGHTNVKNMAKKQSTNGTEMRHLRKHMQKKISPVHCRAWPGDDRVWYQTMVM
jgi:hypothetical protein